MPHFESPTTGVLFAILAAVAACVLLWAGYRIGRFLGAMNSSKTIAAKEQELFTAQRGFKSVYEHELAQLKEQNAVLAAKVTGKQRPWYAP